MQAVLGLVEDDRKTGAPCQRPSATAQWYVPADEGYQYDETGYERGGGYQYEGATQDGDEDFTVDDAAEYLAGLRDNGHALDAADLRKPPRLGGELLNEIAAQLRDAGYDDSRLCSVTQSGVDSMRPWPDGRAPPGGLTLGREAQGH